MAWLTFVASTGFRDLIPLRQAAYISILLFACATAQALAPNENTQFKVLLSKHGLDIGSVKKIYQDKRGYLWFGGSDGLARYDGYTFARFNKTNDNINSLSNNNVTSILEDNKSRLWIGTDSGINLYSKEQSSFTRFHIPDSDRTFINDMALDGDGNIWLATLSGVAKFDTESYQFHVYANTRDEIKGTHSLTARSLVIDKEGNLWNGTFGRGLSHFNTTTKEYTLYTQKKNGLPTNLVSALQVDHEDNLWIGADGGFGVFNRLSKQYEEFRLPDGSAPFHKKSVSDIFHEADGVMWVGTSEGLYYINKGHSSLVKIVNRPTDAQSISANAVTDIFRDRNGDFWFGTFPEGVSYLNSSDLAFRTTRQSQEADTGLSKKSVLCFEESATGELWIGTDGGGITIFDPASGNHEYITTTPDKTRSRTNISSTAILTIEEDFDGTFWIGTWGGGLNHYNPKTKTFSHYLSSDDLDTTDQLRSSNVWKIFRDSKNRLWIGTIGGSLYLYNREQDNFTQFLHDPEHPNDPRVISSALIWTIYETRDGILWFGTERGLDSYNPITGQFTHYTNDPEDDSSISYNIVLSIYEDKNANLWVGTRGGGLNRLNRDTGKFKRYSNDNSSSQLIATIEGDDRGNLWMGTHAGITSFNIASATFTTYDSENGLQGNKFNFNASIKLRNGDLIFGGTQGYTQFDPDHVSSNTYVPPIVITDLKISNKSVYIGDVDSPLQNVVDYTQTITLTHKQNVFSFDFAALSYRVPGKNQYAYLLEGFDKKWNFVGNKRTATYTNLDPGNYTLQISASNNDGVWTNQHKSINIHVLPPL